MAAPLRYHGMSSVNCAIVIVQMLAFACADPRMSTSKTSKPPQRTGEVVKSLMLAGSWWQTIRHLFLDPPQQVVAAMLNDSTVLNLVKLVPLLIPCIWIFYRRSQAGEGDVLADEGPGIVSDSVGTATSTDPGLLKKYSTYLSYHVPETGFTYPSIRTFHRPHPQVDKLPSTPRPIPLLVFIHGLGGSVAQFHPLLTSLVNLAPSLAIDLPGCGLSKFQPKAWGAYTPGSLAQLLAVVIDKHRDIESGQGVILICHSMGCSLAALLASSTSPYASLISEHVLGMIAICPAAEPPDKKQAATFRKLLNIPGPIFDLWRRWDRRGGTESVSVARFVGPDAEEETKKLQVRFNQQSRTPVWRRMAFGVLPDFSTGEPLGGMPGQVVWSGLRAPLFLVAGEADKVTPADNVGKIAAFLGREDEVQRENYAIPKLRPVAKGSSTRTKTSSDQGTNPASPNLLLQAANAAKKRVFKVLILPSPASHALLYSRRIARPLSAHIQTFLASNVDQRLSLGWQLQYLTTEGKWDVKNLEKWQAVKPVSPPIAGVFRAMKTLREVDDSHTPKMFVREWARVSNRGSSAVADDATTANEGAEATEPSPSDSYNGKDGLGAIAAVVDISHESPVYNPQGLEDGGIEYRKFPTVSKFPPSLEEVRQFLEIIDGLRRDLLSEDALHHPVIAVHCHYGFNRTGFFIVAYMVERMKYKLEDALAEFAEKRPRGVRHEHFVTELYGRYWTRDE